MASGSQASGQWEQRLGAARNGSPEALGQLLEGFRQYLLLVANRQLPPDLRPKVGASDLVQETFLEAQRDFAQFHGLNEDELRAWLARILLNNLANVTRQYRATGMRQIGREVSLGEASLDELDSPGATRVESPDARVIAQDETNELERALEQLPEHYRQVILLRHREHQAFEAIGQRLGRSAEAARKLWARAVQQLQQILEPPHDPR